MIHGGPPSEGTGESVRLRLDLSYDGTDFVGWARQPGQRTVLGVLCDALDVLVPQHGLVTVAGRTDSGVHAIGQVAHVDLPSQDVSELLARLAGVLPDDVRVREIRAVPAEFDARFAALWRRYRYRVSDSPWGVDPLRRRDTLHWTRTLDEGAMQQAAMALIGTHDFAAYCRRKPGGTTIRHLQELRLERSAEIVSVWAKADAFCHSMVRSLVGALLAVGDGRRPTDWPMALLAMSTRADDVQVAPPHGLTLVDVGYPPDDQLTARTAATRSARTLDSPVTSS